MLESGPRLPDAIVLVPPSWIVRLGVAIRGWVHALVRDPSGLLPMGAPVVVSPELADALRDRRIADLLRDPVIGRNVAMLLRFVVQLSPPNP